MNNKQTNPALHPYTLPEGVVLEAKDIVTTFYSDGQRAEAVTGSGLTLKQGEIIGLVGESGSGKSVTSMSILQLIMPPGKIESGEVYLKGTTGNILEYGFKSSEMRSIRGGKIGMIFQEPMTSLNPVLTIGYQIQETIMLHLKLDKDAAKQRTLEIMRKVGISDPESRYNQYPQHFSGGMRQRIMIAMAIAAEPEVLIADEATTALDVTTQAQILDLLQELARDKGFSIIIVTHNLGLVARYADRIYVMYGGNIVESGDKFTLFENPIHPYTRGLLDAIPRLDDSKDRRLTPIEGNPPSPVNRKPYCQFYDRCRYREDRCTRCAAPLTEYEPGHKVRCLLSSAELDEKKKHLVRSGKAVAKKTVSTEPILQVEGLKMYFPVYKGLMKRKVADVKALDDVSFPVYRGETLGIVGESGCGKSTLARCIMRAYKPTGGQILYDGKDLCRANAAELRRVHAKIAMIFQDPFASLDPRQNAGSIVGEPLKVGRLCNSREEYNARVDELLTMVGLDPSFKHRVPREFSGGQRQRLGIARAIASRPDVILCDEPVSALDVSIQAQVINLLEDLQAELGITYLFIAHDLSVVKHISDRIIVMYLGKIMEIAPCEELYSHPLHPYTRALLSAVPIADPKVDKDRERIEMLGEVPSVMNRPAGCPFSNRCRYATERCRTETPPMRSVGADHSIACMRKILPFNQGWQFRKDGETSWQTVDLPHTWNALDGQDGGDNYYQGIGWYQKTFTAPDAAQIFIRFGAASKMASVFCNGQFVGEHRGGFSAFTMDLTPYLHSGENELTVKVDNHADLPVYPAQADFTFFGGLYAHLGCPQRHSAGQRLERQLWQSGVAGQ